jgi:hypothetical protein
VAVRQDVVRFRDTGGSVAQTPEFWVPQLVLGAATQRL